MEFGYLLINVSKISYIAKPEYEDRVLSAFL